MHVRVFLPFRELFINSHVQYLQDHVTITFDFFYYNTFFLIFFSLSQSLRCIFNVEVTLCGCCPMTRSFRFRIILECLRCLCKLATLISLSLMTIGIRYVLCVFGVCLCSRVCAICVCACCLCLCARACV